MKKLLAIIATVALTVTMLCSVASAESIYDGSWWDLKINARKADSANVVKDGKIGENEYDLLEFDNSKLTINFQSENDEKHEKLMKDVEKVRDTIKFYFSWDEKNGLNLAVQYQPIEWNDNDYTTEAHEEYILFSKAGGILLTASDSISPKAPEHGNGYGLYMGLALNSKDELLYCGYDNQTGFANGWTKPEGKDKDGYYGGYTPDATNACAAYDKATKLVTYEWSIPLNQVRYGDNKEIYLHLAVHGALSTGKTLDDAKNNWSLNLGVYGFYAGQHLSQYNMTAISLSDEAVGYVEPEETPTPTPPTETPTETPAGTPDVKPADDGNNNGWMLYVIIIEAVAIVALAAVVVMKKKK